MSSRSTVARTAKNLAASVRPRLFSAIAAIAAFVPAAALAAPPADDATIEPTPDKKGVVKKVVVEKPKVKVVVKTKADDAERDPNVSMRVVAPKHGERVEVATKVVHPKKKVVDDEIVDPHVETKLVAKVKPEHVKKVEAVAVAEPRVEAKVIVPKAPPGAHVDAKLHSVTKTEAREMAANAPPAHGKVVEHGHTAPRPGVEIDTRIHVATKAPKIDANTEVMRVDGKPKVEESVKPHGKTAARTPITDGGRRKPGVKGEIQASGKPCKDGRHAQHVHVDRGGLEPFDLSLLDCKGKPLASAQERLSVLVRPWGAAKPALATAGATLPKVNSKGEIAPGVRLLDPGLLTRLDAISKHFPGKSFSFVSGYRPQSRGSLHQTGRAVDVRLTGVSNEDLVGFCKTLKDTGCGYYPNSSFVHVDVRNPKTGSTSWIDASGPGEAPHYVAQWPPPHHITQTSGEQVKEEVIAAPADEEPHDDVPSEDLPRHKIIGEYPDHL